MEGYGVTEFLNPTLRQISSHYRAAIDDRKTKMNRGQKIHPIGWIPAIAWIELLVCFFVLFLNPANLIFRQIFGHQGAKTDGRKTKMNRGQETTP